ncbi:MAG: 4Fe-4S binding protein [Coriobacteriales bacterium]|jgi:pyruvate ferredoxin oxidoreductase delta subunit|nr:4Fe-4S binding protein [Coriobacteriales bacterium]
MSAKKATKTAQELIDFESWTSEEIPNGAVCEDAGNSALYITGGWRSEMPLWTKDNCKDCMLCWVHCPDSSILVADGKMTGIDYDHCKGCGVCVIECKFEALEMVSESSDEARATAAAYEQEKGA